jgi:hypothetical protein
VDTVPLRNWRAELDNAAWIRHMLSHSPSAGLTAVVMPAHFPVIDVKSLARAMADPAGREAFSRLVVVPVEAERLPDPLDPSQVLVLYRTFEQPKPDWLRDAA